MPSHVCKRAIYEHKEENHKEHIARETHTLGKRTRDERGCDDGKLHLEQGIERQRNCCSTEYLACRSGIDITSYIVEHKECRRVAYDTTNIVAKAE